MLVIGGSASARLVWTRIFASPRNDWINDLVALADGTTMAVGFLGREDSGTLGPGDWRALAAAIGDDGAVRASNEYGAGGGIDAFWSMAEGAGGRRAFAGFTTRIGSGGINGWSLIAASDGTIVRENAHGGGGYDRFTDLAPAGDGWVMLGHSQLPGDERRRAFIVRMDADGLPIWERIIAGPYSLGALYIEPAGDGGFVVAGGIGTAIAGGEAHDSGGRKSDSDMLVLKLDGEGRELWRRTIGTPGGDDVNHGLVVRPDGRIVVVGYSKSWGSRDNDILAATLSPDGEVLRRELLGGAADDRPIQARLDAAGRVWIVGYTRSAGEGGWDVIVARLDAAGSFEGGVLTLGGQSDDNGTAIRPLADGSLLVAGYSPLGRGGEDAFVVRIALPSWPARHPAFVRRVVNQTVRR